MIFIFGYVFTFTNKYLTKLSDMWSGSFKLRKFLPCVLSDKSNFRIPGGLYTTFPMYTTFPIEYLAHKWSLLLMTFAVSLVVCTQHSTLNIWHTNGPCYWWRLPYPRWHVHNIPQWIFGTQIVPVTDDFFRILGGMYTTFPIEYLAHKWSLLLMTFTVSPVVCTQHSPFNIWHANGPCYWLLLPDLIFLPKEKIVSFESKH